MEEEQVAEAEERAVKAEVVVLEPGGAVELDMQKEEGAPRSEIDDRLTDSG